ncbi:MAG: hypothetical protein AVDCRST_MAG25-2237 [uncultured Rubrobacteraceae bacterium]|uniref:Uncharacterized protein n=1 Tax=uncultured Rubrobacteraceae bacterium TaxID=349277 RepID=A0A6J4RNF4_9ACTN|nr:MAG: hypothetical protein AVDCRST_MAG25-2237 [uncultured Rubrobacteraceae bacterium]
MLPRGSGERPGASGDRRTPVRGLLRQSFRVSSAQLSRVARGTHASRAAPEGILR